LGIARRRRLLQPKDLAAADHPIEHKVPIPDIVSARGLGAGRDRSEEGSQSELRKKQLTSATDVSTLPYDNALALKAPLANPQVDCMAKSSHLDLGRRERQIMDTVHQLGEATVHDVLARLPDPPSYSSVRTMMRLLEEKEFLKHRRDGMKYVYRSTVAPEKVRRSALQHLLKTFFAGSAGDAVAAVLDLSGNKISSEELDRLALLIEEARKEGR
jgi:predicted transcriptional regulator